MWSEELATPHNYLGQRNAAHISILSKVTMLDENIRKVKLPLNSLWEKKWVNISRSCIIWSEWCYFSSQQSLAVCMERSVTLPYMFIWFVCFFFFQTHFPPLGVNEDQWDPSLRQWNVYLCGYKHCWERDWVSEAQCTWWVGTPGFIVCKFPHGTEHL